MGHTPNAENGMALIADGNSGILEALARQSDIVAARLEEDRVASLEAIKQRHANELKAAKRNFKQRKKRLGDRMATFEKMTPTQLADAFPNGHVPDGEMASNSWGGLHSSYLTQLTNTDFSQLESRDAKLR